MGFNLNVIGRESDPVEIGWTDRDTLLYALGVGSGLGDPVTELAFTTENSSGLVQRVLPTFGVIVAPVSLPPDIGAFELSKVLHAEQGITLHAALPAEGRVRVTSAVTGIFDKGSGALIKVSSAARTTDGELMIETRSGIFIRDAGGFGGVPSPPSLPPVPERPADHVVAYETRPEQALIYRLSGDRNPLHSDPRFAQGAGFERPILHGLCTYGFVGRALLNSLCGGDPARFRSMDGRFSQTVFPGETLTVSIWREGQGEARFNVTGANNAIVLERGQVIFTDRDVS